MENLKTIFISIILFAFIYLFGCFYSATFDISKWTESVRFVVVLFGAFAFIITGIVIKIK